MQPSSDMSGQESYSQGSGGAVGGVGGMLAGFNSNEPDVGTGLVGDTELATKADSQIELLGQILTVLRSVAPESVDGLEKKIPTPQPSVVQKPGQAPNTQNQSTPNIGQPVDMRFQDAPPSGFNMGR